MISNRIALIYFAWKKKSEYLIYYALFLLSTIYNWLWFIAFVIRSFSGSIMFHVRRRPADSQPRRRKKKPLGVSNGSNHVATDREGPILVEITHSGEGARSVKLTAEPIEVSNLTYYQNRLINICSRLLISIMTYIHIDVPYQRNNNNALLFFFILI